MTFNDGRFWLSQIGLIPKVLEYIGVDHSIGSTTPTRVEFTLDPDENGTDTKIYFTNSYYSEMFMMFYL